MNKTERISPGQLAAVASCFLLGSILRSVYISRVTAQDSWMMGFSGLIVYLPILVVYYRLILRYPGKNLFQINEAVFGGVIGRIFSALYLYFFITLCAMNVALVGSFLVNYIMPGTPFIAVAVLFMLACCYALYKGFEPMARLSTMFVLFSFLIIVFTAFLSISQSNPDYLLPIFVKPLIDYVQGTHVAVAIPYGEAVVMMMLVPLLGDKPKVKKPMVITSAITLVVMVVVHMREALMLGPLLPYTTLPAYETLRLISVGSAITRTESIYAFILISLTFFKVTTIFYACVKGFCQITRSTSYKSYVLILGALIVVYAARCYPMPVQNESWGSDVTPFIWSFFECVLPLVTILVAWIKGMAGKKRKAGKAVQAS